MTIARVRMWALVIAIMSGFTAVSAARKSKKRSEVVMDSCVSCVDTADTCAQIDAGINTDVITVTVEVPVTIGESEGACAYGVSTSAVSKRAERRKARLARNVVTCEQVAPEWEVTQAQQESKVDETSVVNQSRVERNKIKQEQYGQLQHLSEELQAIMSINPLEENAAGLVRTSQDNKDLAVRLAHIAQELQAAGFKLNMAYVTAQVDELNEEPGTLSAMVRNYVNKIDALKQAQGHQVHEVQQRDMIILEQEQTIRALEEQRAQLIAEKQQAMVMHADHLHRLQKELEKARSGKAKAEHAAAQAHGESAAKAQAVAEAQAQTAQAQEQAHKALEQAQTAQEHVQKSDEFASPEQEALSDVSATKPVSESETESKPETEIEPASEPVQESVATESAPEAESESTRTETQALEAGTGKEEPAAGEVQEGVSKIEEESVPVTGEEAIAKEEENKGETATELPAATEEVASEVVPAEKTETQSEEAKPEEAKPEEAKTEEVKTEVAAHDVKAYTPDWHQ